MINRMGVSIFPPYIMPSYDTVEVKILGGMAQSAAYNYALQFPPLQQIPKAIGHSLSSDLCSIL